MDLKQLIRTRRPPYSELNAPAHVLFASSEVAPFSKTGGLGDVAAALPKALAQQGHHVSVLTPFYKGVRDQNLHLSRRLRPLVIPTLGLNRGKKEAIIWEGRDDSGVRLFFVDVEGYFERDDLYGYDADKQDQAIKRFALFSRAIVEFARWAPATFDAIHCNDWHTALAPLYASHYYDGEFEDTSFIFTIHNLAYQGRFDSSLYKTTGLPMKYWKDQTMSEDGEINFLKAGVLMSDQVTTVSPTYAKEIQQPGNGFGLSEALKSRAQDLDGVLNGVDYNIWSPDHDEAIEVPYTVDTLNGKRRNKAALQHRFELPIRPMVPLLGFVGRLTQQKGLDILIPALDELLGTFTNEREGFQAVFLGTGETTYREQLEALAKKYPKRVSVVIGYKEDLAHQIQAGSDILLVPSRFEPCGLTQIYAMRYGTLPLVHATGGLADTVVNSDDEHEISTGFVFNEYDKDQLKATITKATKQFKHYRTWRPLMVNAMSQDFSWEASAKHYVRLYKSKQIVEDEDE